MGSPGEGSEEREQEPLGWGKAIRSAQRPGGGGAVSTTATARLCLWSIHSVDLALGRKKLH